MSANELIQRRGAMMQSRSGGIDWESIARGMCDGVSEFDIPEEIGLNAICVCSDRKGLKSAVVVSGTGTAQNMFLNCTSLLSVTLNGSISNIRNYSFRGATNLREVIIEATTPPTLGTNVFQYIDTSQLTIYVPDASVSAYQAASGWSTYASIIKPISQRPT